MKEMKVFDENINKESDTDIESVRKELRKALHYLEEALKNANKSENIDINVFTFDENDDYNAHIVFLNKEDEDDDISNCPLVFKLEPNKVIKLSEYELSEYIDYDESILKACFDELNSNDLSLKFELVRG